MNRINQYINKLHGRSFDILHEIEQNNVIGDEIFPYLGANAGRFLYNYTLMIKPKKILELGTGCGYATICMAMAASSYGGEIISVEKSAYMQNVAKKNITKAGFNNVNFVLSDVKSWVKNCNHKYDLILQDTYPKLYSEMLNDCIELLNPNKPLITHDALIKLYNAQPEMVADMEQFNNLLKQNNKLYSSIIPVDDGLWLSIKNTVAERLCSSS